MNPFSNNSEASAWSENDNDFLFFRVHSHIALHLGECCEVHIPLGGVNVLQNAPLRFAVRCHPEEAARLWQYVPAESVRKEWEFHFDGTKSRMHSATEFKCLSHFIHFVNKDHRLLFNVELGNPIAVVNFPLKRATAVHVVPPGTLDDTGAVIHLPNKIAAYQVWAMNMKTQYPDVTILESVNEMDITHLHQLAIYPLRYCNGQQGNESFVEVFVPGYKNKQENREVLHCKGYRLGTLMYGSSYKAGGSADFLVYGYVFAIPVLLLKADSAEPYLFRVNRTARKLNRNSS